MVDKARADCERQRMQAEGEHPQPRVETRLEERGIAYVERTHQCAHMLSMVAEEVAAERGLESVLLCVEDLLCAEEEEPGKKYAALVCMRAHNQQKWLETILHHATQIPVVFIEQCEVELPQELEQKYTIQEIVGDENGEREHLLKELLEAPELKDAHDLKDVAKYNHKYEPKLHKLAYRQTRRKLCNQLGRQGLKRRMSASEQFFLKYKFLKYANAQTVLKDILQFLDQQNSN